MVRVSIGSVSRLETRFRAQPVGVKGAFSRRGTSIQSGAIARLRDFGLSRSVLWVTNHRIRRLPQARLVRGTIRAFVAADNFNVTPHPMTLRPIAHQEGGAIGDSACRRIRPAGIVAPIHGSQSGVSAWSAFRSGAFPVRRFVRERNALGLKGRFPAGDAHTPPEPLPPCVTAPLIGPFYV
jgi:hypothetical protein